MHPLTWKDLRMKQTRPAELLTALFNRHDRHEWTDTDVAIKLVSVVESALNVHQPRRPPAGATWVSGGDDAHCDGCGNANPFDDQSWPCETVRAIVDALEADEIIHH